MTSSGKLHRTAKMLIERSRVCHSHKPQPNLDTKRKRKRTKTYTRKTNKKCTRSTKPAPSSPSEVFRMLKQTEKRGQRAREDFETLSAPWYKPKSYTELRTTLRPKICLDSVLAVLSITQIFAGKHVLGLSCFEQVIKSPAKPRQCGDDHEVKTNE